MKDMKVQSARIGKAVKQGGGHWVWSLPESLDGQDALCGESEHLNPGDAVKVLTPGHAVGTNQVKMLTENPQTTSTPDTGQGEHLNSADAVPRVPRSL